MRIGELSEITGVPRRLLRYYEEQELLLPAREDNGYRVYDADAPLRVRQIRSMLESGLSTASIRRLLPRVEGSDAVLHAPPDPEVAADLRKELEMIETRMGSLAQSRKSILCYLNAPKWRDEPGEPTEV
jgi:DNA-binding transcriptional MerR regulator